MSHLVSIQKTDGRFAAYMRGTFSEDHRAIPQQTLQRNTEKEEVVFRVYSKGEVERPGFLQVWFQTIRWQYLSFTATPIFATLAVLFYQGREINLRFAVLSLLGAVFLQIAAHLFNDYSDHIRGWDRLHSSRGSRSIQKGWLSAVQVQKGGLLFCILGSLCGAPVVYFQPKLFSLVAVFALLGVFEFSSNRLALKYRGLGELALLILTGPVMTLAVSQAVSGRISFDIFILGLLFGFLASYVYHLKDIEELMSDASGKSSTLALTLGFDRAKWLAYLGIWILPLGIALWAFWGPLTIPLTVTALAVAQKSFQLSKKIKGVVSTFSSGLSQARELGLRLHFFTGFALILSFVFCQIFAV